MRNIINTIKDAKRVADNNNKSYDFADGRHTLQIGTKNAKLVDNTMCTDENGMVFKYYAIFEMTNLIKSALLETVQEGLEHRITHNVLVNHAKTVGTLSSGTGVNHTANMEISIMYEPISRSRVLYVWDADHKSDCPLIGIVLKTYTFKDYSKCICNLVK